MDLEEEIQCLQENPETDSDRIMEFSGKEKLYLTELGELKKKLKKAETSLKEYEDENLDLRAQLAVYKDKEKEFKRQLEALSSLVISDGAHQRTVDLQRVYDQLLYKDGRIVELNNQILEKERQIMDLQEAVREQGEVALAKSKAVQIVNQRLQEIDSRHTKDASTETDVVFTERNARTGRKQRVNSPGRAIPQLRLGTNGSPPPLDPSEDVSSYTTETATYDDPDREWSPSPSASAALNRISKKYRKKVTFDLKPPGSKKEVRVKREVVSPDPARVSMQGVDNELAQQIIDLTNENDELRRIIAEIERAPVPEQDLKIAQLEEEVENVRRNAKNQLLRTRATAQAKMKEMETKIFELQKTQTLEVDSLNATNEALKSGRDFVLEENAKLLDELNRLKQKESDLMSELDGSVALSLNYRRELDTELRRITELRQELKDAQAANQQVLDEKQEAYGEVEKLKEALFAQGELIRMLEGDLIVYETQVGLLRDSLGASKVEVREQVKSKAISAVSALDEGKQQDLLKKRNDEKLKVKALHVKVRYLEQERDELLQWVQKHERFDFAPRSLEDLKRLATNRGTVAPSSVGPLPRSSVSSILTEPTVGTPYNEDNSVFNTTQSTVDNTVAELMKKLEIAHIENEKLGKELLETKSKNLVTSQGNILNLLETVENLSTVNPVDAIPGTYRIPEDTVDRDEVEILEKENRNLKETNKSLEEELESIRIQINQYEKLKKVTEEVHEILKKEKSEIQNAYEDLKNQLIQKDEEILRAEMKNETNIGSATEWQKEIARLREENQNLVEIKNEFEERSKEIEDLKNQLAQKDEDLLRAEMNVGNSTGWDEEVEDLRNQSVLRNQDLSRKEIDVRNSTEWQKEVEDLRNQLVQKDQDLLRAEMKNEMNVGSSTEWQKEIARLREENQNLIEIKNEVEEKLSEVEEDLQTIILEKERINEKLKEIEERNVVLSESNERVKKFERENNKLENLVEILRNQVEQFQFEAELSRTCLEDLRKNIISKAGSQNLGNVERNPSVDEVITTRTAMEALQRTGLINVDGGRQPQGNLNDRNQVLGYENLGYQEQHPQGQIQNQHAQADNYQGPVQNQPVQGPAQNQANQVENYQQGQIQNQPVQMENYQGAIQNQYAQVESYQQVPVQNQSVQLENYQHAGSAPPITEGSYYEQQQAHQQSQQQIHQQPQQQPQQHDAYQLPSASTGSMEAEFNQLRSQYSQLYSAYSQMQGYYEVREKELVDEKNNLNLKIEDLSEKLTRAEKSIEENFEESTKIENEYFLEKEKNKELEKITEELKETKTKLTANEGELVQLRNQMERMDNDYNQLRDTNKKLEHFLNETRTSLSEAESARNNLAAENSQLRQVKDQLEILLDEAKSRQEQSQEREDQLRSEVVSESLLVQKNHELKEENKVLEKNLKSAEDNINLNTESIMNSTLAAFDDEFDNYRIPRSTVNAGIQCDIIDNTVAQVGKVISGDEPHLNELLVNYVRETNNFNEYLSQDVENLFVLNNELASAADSLKGQVWALNEQLKKSMVERQEILDQLEKIEENNSSVFEENEKLRNELNEKEIILSEFKEQNDKWEKEVRNLQEKKFELEVAYGQLSEKYEQIQTTYENVISKMKIPKLDKSTDPFLDGSYFNSAQDVFEKYKNLETVSSQLKKDLESQTSKIRSLEEGIKENSSIGKEFFEDLSRGLSFENTVADAEARGAKSTAHSAMLEIKKLLMEAAETLHKLPIDEAYDTVRKETEIKCSRKVRNAVSFCEKVFSEMEKCESEGTESEEKFELPVGTEPDGIEFVILRLHERWKTKHNQLLESSSYLKNQQQLYRELESRLSDAQEKLAELETRNSSESAARLTAKQADNDALFRATAELAHTNVALQNQVDDLEEKLAGKVLDESEESEVRDVDSVSKKVEGVEDKDIDSKKLDTAVSTDFDSKKSEAVIDMSINLKKPPSKAIVKSKISVKSSESAKTKGKFNEIKKIEKPISETPKLKVEVESEKVQKQVSPVSELPKVVKDPKEALKKLFGDDSEKGWGWTEPAPEKTENKKDEQKKQDEVEKSGKKEISTKSKSPIPSTTEDWGWGEESTGDVGSSENPHPDADTKSKLVPDSKAKSKSPVSKAKSKSPAPSTTEDWGWGDEPTGDTGFSEKSPSESKAKSKSPDSGVKSKLVPDSKAKSKSPVPPTVDEWGWGEESTGDFGSEKPLHDDFNSKSKNFEEPKAAVDEWSWKEEEPDAAGAWDYDDETGSAPPEVLTEKTKETPVTKEEQDDWAWNEDNQESNSSKVEKPVEKIPDSKTSTSKVSSDSKASNAKKSKEPEKKEPSVDEWSWNEEPAIPKKQKVQEKKETPKKAPEPSKVEDWGWGDSEEIKPESTEPAKAKPSSKKTPKKPSDPEDWAWDDDFGSEPKDKGKSKKSSRRN